MQILGDEFDIDQSARGILQIPDVILALFQRDGAAHLGDVVGDDVPVAWPGQHIADDLLDTFAKLR